MERSIVEYFSGHEGYRCGYCKSSDTFYSHGMWAHALTPLDYQNLIDRGWRRSGKYCYKPTMNMTCCPLYTIRCETKKFTLTKSQKKVLKKVHKFLAFGYKEKTEKTSENAEQEMEVLEVSHEIDVQNVKDIKNIKTIKQSDVETDECEDMCDSTSLHANSESSSSILVQSSPKSSQIIASISSDSSSHKICNESSNHPPCRKAKAIRQEKKIQKLLKQGMSPEVAAASVKKTISSTKSLEDFLSEPFSSEPAHKLVLRLVPSSLENPFFCRTFEESYSIYKKYQMEIHQDPPEKCSTKQYTRFLVNNPFQTFVGVSSSSVYGSFHQQYWLDNKLIAVGVLDILPYCVSSVYFYYDPDYKFLSLGTYAALRELAFTRELNIQYNDLQYYYMGFYIHSCIKMRYKGQYVPSFLLCPETYTFHSIEKCKPKLEISKYHRLEEDLAKEDQDGVVILRDVIVLYNKKRMTYHTYRMTKTPSNDESEVKEYAKLVGQKCYKRMLLYRS